MRKLLLTGVALVALGGVAFADGYDLTHKSVQELTEDTANPAAADWLVRYDTSAGEFKKVGAEDLDAAFDIEATEAEIDNVADNSARIVSVSGTSTMTCAANGTGKINFVSSLTAGGLATLTLPAATATGCEYEFHWENLPSQSGNSGDIVQVTGDDAFYGNFIMAQDGGDTLVMFETAADTDQLTFTSTTQGCSNLGCVLKVKDVATDVWHLEFTGSGTGTEATPGATGQRS